ncbi:MAG: LytTR family DNA-binding domain-containing protein [Eubacterium sp.]|nr:LytTR family DNA-binding domain-containing protein [Eubacterium sp.]
MIYIAIVDDEKTFTQAYKREVAEIFGSLDSKCEISTYTDPAAFQKDIAEIKYDLIFLDIDMPGISGMEIASQLNKLESDAALVFVSNHNNFVFEAFKYSAYRFIRKENLHSDTAEAICSFCNTLKAKENRITLDLENIKGVPINLSSIKYFFSIRHDIYFYNDRNASERLAIRTYTLTDLENMLKGKGFIRIHRTYLLNYIYLYQIRSEKVILKDKSELPLSRERYDAVKRTYQKLINEGGVL